MGSGRFCVSAQKESADDRDRERKLLLVLSVVVGLGHGGEQEVPVSAE